MDNGEILIGTALIEFLVWEIISNLASVSPNLSLLYIYVDYNSIIVHFFTFMAAKWYYNSVHSTYRLLTLPAKRT